MRKSCNYMRNMVEDCRFSISPKNQQNRIGVKLLDISHFPILRQKKLQSQNLKYI